jgi:hypothetical protein
MFTNNSNLIQLGEKAYVYKNFIDQKTVEKINNFYDAKDKNSFIVGEHPIEWYSDKIISGPNDLVDVWNKVSEFLYPDHVIPPNLSIIIMEPGDEPMFVHADSPGEGNHDKLISDDGYDTCPITTWGIVVYFGNWEGGEIFYPQFDIEYLPEPGDMVIHSAFTPWEHGVKPVIKGRRYAYSLFALETNKNPGTFYNYGTQECIDAQKDLNNWMKPLI